MNENQEDFKLVKTEPLSHAEAKMVFSSCIATIANCPVDGRDKEKFKDLNSAINKLGVALGISSNDIAFLILVTELEYK